MKPAPFEYARPQTLGEACALLAANEDARVIAGGQTLVPMMAMRLARPSLLVDIQRLPELRVLAEDNGALVIGAAVRQCEAEGSALVARTVPLLSAALPWVGHAPTRTRGTIGGSIANADPAAEIALVAVTLDAEIVLHTVDGEIRMPADDFFIAAMVTAAPSGACLTSVRFPVWSERHVGVGFDEISARRSDFAYASAAAQIAIDESGRCFRVAFGIGGVGDRPVKGDASALVGGSFEDAAIQSVAERAAAGLEAIDTVHASAAYRKRAAASLGANALRRARDQALERVRGMRT